MKRNQKWKILHTVLVIQTLCFSSSQIKSKTVELAKEKRGHFLTFVF